MKQQSYLKYISISLLLVLALVVLWPKPYEICSDVIASLKELVFGGLKETIDQFTTKVWGDSGEMITVKSDSVQVLNVSEAADLHVCSQEMQDFAVEKQNGECKDFNHHPINKMTGLGEEEHKLILIVREKCYYTVNLSKVKYVVSHSDSTIYITMPELEDKYIFINETDLPDEKDFWLNFSRNNLRFSAKKKIAADFNSKENRKLAQKRANYLVSNLVSDLVQNDYRILVVERIEQKREVED